MRSVLEVLERTGHPVGIVTKSHLVTRDIDILSRMAAKGLAKVAVSITTLDVKLARKMEPRAATPERRLDAINELSKAGIPASVMVAPILPAINDAEIETILARAHANGAREAGYVMLRLPLEVKEIFDEWLQENYPDRRDRVMSLVRSMRDGKAYDSAWGKRMTGEGPYAWMIGRRFETACERLGLNKDRARLRTDLFVAPKRHRRNCHCFEITSVWGGPHEVLFGDIAHHSGRRECREFKPLLRESWLAALDRRQSPRDHLFCAEHARHCAFPARRPCAGLWVGWRSARPFMRLQLRHPGAEPWQPPGRRCSHAASKGCGRENIKIRHSNGLGRIPWNLQRSRRAHLGDLP